MADAVGGPAGAGPAAPPAALGYAALHGSIGMSLLLVLPLLLVYGLGVYLVDTRLLNGVDFLSRYVLAYHGPQGILLVSLLAAFAFLAVTIRLGNDNRFRMGLYVPLLLESAVYAFVLVQAIGWAVQGLHVAGIEMAAVSGRLGPHAGPTLRNTVVSIGAGVFEEIVFRLVLITVIDFVFRDMLEVGRRLSMAIAIIASSVLFALAHHVGPGGEVFDMGIFLLRSGAGLAFAGLYRLRSFAVAVYAHALYDVYVLVL